MVEAPSEEPSPKNKRSTPVPAQALKSRLNTHTAKPTWSAWLPKGLQHGQPDNCQLAEVAYPDATDVNCKGQFDCQPSTCSITGWMTVDGVNYELVTVQGCPVIGYVPAPEGDEEEHYFEQPDASYFGQQICDAQHQLDEQVHPGFSQVGPLTGQVWQLAKDAQGCLTVQQAFDESSEDECLVMAWELMGHVWEALKCPHANHVVQKCIKKVSPENAQFVIDELSCGPGGFAQAARHRFGCRIIERLLEHCQAEQVSPMVDRLVADTVALSSHAFGNFVVQHLLQFCSPDVVWRITCILKDNLSAMSADGYAGDVMKMALSRDTNEAALSLASAVLEDPDRVSIMSCSRYGNNAVKHAFQLVDGTRRQQAFQELARYSDKIRSTRYGRVVLSFVAELQSLQTTPPIEAAPPTEATKDSLTAPPPQSVAMQCAGAGGDWPYPHITTPGIKRIQSHRRRSRRSSE